MERSPLLDRHVAAGARIAERPEAPGIDSPLSFGDVPAEYRSGREGCALFDTCDRGRLSVRGRDSADFLHRLLANDVKGLVVGRGNQSLLLTPQGKVRFDFDLVRLQEGFDLSTPPGQDEALRRALDTYLFSEDVRLATSGEAHAPLELCGPGARAILERLLGRPLALEPYELVRAPWNGAELAVGAVPVAGSRGLRVDAGPQLAGALWRALCELGARPCGLAARDILRVEAGAALCGVDVDEGVYPQEARLDAAFALDKGCYVGQEVVAKIDTYGGLNKSLEALRIDHDEPVPRGTPLLSTKAGPPERRELGLVTSWVYSLALEGGLALGYVKRRHQEPGTRFDLGGTRGQATIVALPVRPDALT